LNVAQRQVFVDTSALYATLDADDGQHETAATGWQQLLDGLESGELAAVTHSSIIVETAALVQRRLGMAAVRTLLDDLLPLFDVVWVNADLHAQATTALLAANQRQISLVDWTSFAVMRQRAIDEAFTFDDDFAQRGFESFVGR
jgi:predicted nucleic acid-binding protein